MHQRAGLIEMGQREGDAEFHRRQRDALFQDRIGGVPVGIGRAAVAVIGRFDQLGQLCRTKSSTGMP